nr:MAG TPA: hypothetical protein [Bacteriophage sp.]
MFLFLFNSIKPEKVRIHAVFPDVYLKCTENNHSSEHKVHICTHLYSPIVINGLIWHPNNILRDFRHLIRA